MNPKCASTFCGLVLMACLAAVPAQGQQMPHGHAMGHASSGVPALPGQDAFGAIQEVVRILEADPATDWSKVNLERLRQHLIDMNEVTLRASVKAESVPAGCE